MRLLSNYYYLLRLMTLLQTCVEDSCSGVWSPSGRSGTRTVFAEPIDLLRPIIKYTICRRSHYWLLRC